MPRIAVSQSLQHHRRASCRATPRAVVGLFAALALFGCSPSERDSAAPPSGDLASAGLEASRERIDAGREGANARELQAASNALREYDPKSEAELLELVRLMLSVGDAPQAMWRLDRGVERFGDSDPLRLSRARVAIVLGDYVRADDALAQIGPQSPERAAAQVLRAKVQLELGNLEKSQVLLERARAQFPDDDSVIAAGIWALLSEQRVDLAVDLLERERLRASGESQRLLLDLLAAQFEARRGNTSAALGQMQRLAARHPDNSLVAGVLLRTLLREGEFERARGFALASVERRPDDPVAISDLALVHEIAGDFREAEQVLRRLIEISDSAVQRVRLIRLHDANGQQAAAAVEIRRAAEAFPDFIDFRVGAVESLLDAGETVAAERALRDYEAVAKGNPHANYLRARLAIESDENPQAVALLRAIIGELDTAYAQFWLGVALEGEGDFAGAMRRYGLAAQRGPRSADLLRAMARIHSARGAWPEVAETARALASVRPDDPEGLDLLARALLNAGEIARAAEVGRTFVERFPELRRGPAHRVRAHLAGGDAAAAGAVLAAAIERFGETPDYANLRALQLGAAGDAQAGLTAATRAIEGAPAESRYYVTRARLLAQLERPDEALAALAEARALAPGDAEPLHVRALLRSTRGDFAGAADDLRELERIQPENAAMLALSADIQQRLGNRDEATGLLMRSVALAPHAAMPLNNLALLLDAAGERRRALQYAQRAYGLAPDEPAIIDTVAWLYLKEGLAERSVALLERASAFEGSDPEVQLHLALAYRAVRRTEDARAALAALAKRIDPRSELRAEVDAALSSLAPSTTPVN